MDDEEFDITELIGDMDDSVANVLADPDHTQLVVRAAHVAVAMVLLADNGPAMPLTQRAKFYDDASAILALSLVGSEGLKAQIVATIQSLLHFQTGGASNN